MDPDIDPDIEPDIDPDIEFGAGYCVAEPGIEFGVGIERFTRFSAKCASPETISGSIPGPDIEFRTRILTRILS